ncbi:VapC toxin family PIN domain ribonuclease [Kaistia algarum]|uniref:PIN domain-containing protein n=1 Tax=Kaistia algarum TaxID=2083279 RepID=UPI000CE886CE|nr:PIN domain-containing protein [Kaistia algarum]MCX5512148.1 PIN domain-containing protein [Kaistia algarum]PPE80252.1 VapC toxin family PIN domain ribonuclease [Kaistia algarum]
MIIATGRLLRGQGERRDLAISLLQKLRTEDVIVPAQMLGELFNVLLRKAVRTRVEARDAVLAWQESYKIIETSSDGLVAATDLAADHQFAIWDAVILSAASRTGCCLLLTEDMQDGFTWGGVTVVNPFGEEVHSLLGAVIAG